MTQLNEKQKLILDHLLAHSEGATADELAVVISVSKTAAKEHINKLEYQGLLNFRDEKGIVGRPKRFYILSHQGSETFPRQYSWLSNVLLAHLTENLGKSKVTSMMRDMADQVASGFTPRLSSVRPERRMDEVIDIMNELGFKAKSGKNKKGQTIEAVNCIYHNVAKAHPELCQFDIRFLEQATGKSVELESCIARGGTSCRFCVR